MLVTDVILQIDKNEDSYFPCLSLLSVFWSTTDHVLADLTFLSHDELE